MSGLEKSPGAALSTGNRAPSAFASAGSAATGEQAAAAPEVGYFALCLDMDRMLDRLREEKKAGRRIIGLMAWGVPSEIILASGAVPVRLAGLSLGEGRNLTNLPRDICPLAASFITEALLLKKEGLLDAVALPETCDWKSKLPALLGELKVLTLPAPSSGNLTFVTADLKRFARELALITDLPVVPRNLKRASQTIADAEAAYAALLRLRQLSESRLSGVAALMIEHSFLREDPSCWTEHCHRLVRELEQASLIENHRQAETSPRIMLLGSPLLWKGASLVHIVEESGGNVVCEDANSRLSLLYSDDAGVNRAGTDDFAIASRWSRSCFCSLAAEVDSEFLFRVMGDFSVNGVILHTYRSCARTQMSLPRLMGCLRDRGIPAIAIETQGDPHEEEQVRARIEPFITLLRDERRKDA